MPLSKGTVTEFASLDMITRSSRASWSTSITVARSTGISRSTAPRTREKMPSTVVQRAISLNSWSMATDSEDERPGVPGADGGATGGGCAGVAAAGSGFFGAAIKFVRIGGKSWPNSQQKNEKATARLRTTRPLSAAGNESISSDRCGP